MMEKWIVGGIVAVAAGAAIVRLVRLLRGRGGCHCEGCTHKGEGCHCHAHQLPDIDPDELG